MTETRTQHIFTIRISNKSINIYDLIVELWYDTMNKVKKEIEMEKELLQELKDEIQLFKEQTEKFVNKEISVKDFKGFSGGFGSYAQRGAQTFMLRLRMNQGVMSKDKLGFICKVCKEHNVQKAHITTCQTIQLHDLNSTCVPNIMEEALDHGIVTRGGGGDFPRNVMCSPLSGVDPMEVFDVRPYAEAVGDYLLSIVNKYSLPRKLKVAFSNSPRNETHANFRDLGFIANEDHTFDVYCAGGLGNNPKMGVKVGDHVDPKYILYYVSTMVLLFMEYGNYENRAKARTRYMQDTLGIEGLQREFSIKVARAIEGQNHDLMIEDPVIIKTGKSKSFDDSRIFVQKQQGLYAVTYHPIAGTLHPEKLEALYELIKDMEEVSIRICPQQGMYIINLNAEEAQRVLEFTKDGAANDFEASVACIGATTCQVGLRDSQGALQTAIQALRDRRINTNRLPRCFFSGCTSSCGTNQIGALGFQGSVKLVDKKPLPAFQLSILGNDHENNTLFGERAGVILETDISDFLEDLANSLNTAQMPFEIWALHHKDTFQEILQKYL